MVSEALARLTDPYERVGLEAGPLSQWLYFGLKDAGLPAICVETRHMKSAIVAMTQNKNDRNDARSIAQVVRAGWFKQVHVKSTKSQELRTLLITREFLVNKIRDHENEIRGACLVPACDGTLEGPLIAKDMLWAGTSRRRHTTRAVRAAPQRSKASIQELRLRYGIDPTQPALGPGLLVGQIRRVALRVLGNPGHSTPAPSGRHPKSEPSP